MIYICIFWRLVPILLFLYFDYQRHKKLSESERRQKGKKAGQIFILVFLILVVLFSRCVPCLRYSSLEVLMRAFYKYGIVGGLTGAAIAFIFFKYVGGADFGLLMARYIGVPSALLSAVYGGVISARDEERAAPPDEVVRQEDTKMESTQKERESEINLPLVVLIPIILIIIFIFVWTHSPHAFE